MRRIALEVLHGLGATPLTDLTLLPVFEGANLSTHTIIITAIEIFNTNIISTG